MDLDFAIEHLPRLLKAAKLTIELTLLSLFFGIFVGVFFAILRTSNSKVLYYISYYYSYIFRGTPLLVQIFIIYFGLAQLEWIRESFLWVFLKEPYSCAILAFTLNTGAYSSEIFRSAFETINKGIVEAAKGLGLNKLNTFFKIKLPIAIRQSLPAYGNEMILMLKGTSLASTVTLLDLTGVAKHIISTTFRPVEVFIVAGSIYLLMTFVIHNLIKYLERRYNYS
ncbi:ABC transporter permease subunit [Pelagibacteraceae bacterium]|nr:ABC transporter permease subunit [Pelagibacteraceae bacterium]